VPGEVEGDKPARNEVEGGEDGGDTSALRELTGKEEES